MAGYPVLITTSGVTSHGASVSTIVHVFPNKEAALTAIARIDKEKYVDRNSVFVREALALFDPRGA